MNRHTHNKNPKQRRSKSKNRFGPANAVRKVWTCPVCKYQTTSTYARDKHVASGHNQAT